MPPSVNLWYVITNKNVIYLVLQDMQNRLKRHTLFKTIVILTFKQIDDFDMTVASVHHVYYKEICINHV